MKKEQVSEKLGCSKAKGEVDSEKHPIYPGVAGEIVSESTILEAEEKGELVRNVSHDEILMQEHREIRRIAGTCAADRTLQYAHELYIGTTQRLRGSWRP